MQDFITYTLVAISSSSSANLCPNHLKVYLKCRSDAVVEGVWYTKRSWEMYRSRYLEKTPIPFHYDYSTDLCNKIYAQRISCMTFSLHEVSPLAVPLLWREYHFPWLSIYLWLFVLSEEIDFHVSQVLKHDYMFRLLIRILGFTQLLSFKRQKSGYDSPVCITFCSFEILITLGVVCPDSPSKVNSSHKSINSLQTWSVCGHSLCLHLIQYKKFPPSIVSRESSVCKSEVQGFLSVVIKLFG